VCFLNSREDESTQKHFIKIASNTDLYGRIVKLFYNFINLQHVKHYKT
jgi:hypothetical protein